MPQELPIACTLEGAALAERGRQMAKLGEDALTGVELDGIHAVLRFHDARMRVAELVEAESRCCAFLDFAVANVGDDTTLDVRAPEGADEALRLWVAAIAGDRAPV